MGENIFADVVTLIIVAAFFAAVIITVLQASRQNASKKYLAKLKKSVSALYFYGFSFDRVWESQALIRAERWFEVEMSKWWAPLGMLILKDNPTATLYHGLLFEGDKAGEFHAWVEFDVWYGEKYVLDFAWIGSGFITKKKYQKWLKGDGLELVPLWKCDHTAFWTFAWTNFLWERMSNPKTSHILEGLDVYVNPSLSDGSKVVKIGFRDDIKELNPKDFSFLGIDTIPWKVVGSNKIISSGTIQDFIKYPKLKAPRTKTLKRSYRLYREYYSYYTEDELELHNEITNDSPAS